MQGVSGDSESRQYAEPHDKAQRAFVGEDKTALQATMSETLHCVSNIIEYRVARRTTLMPIMSYLKHSIWL